MIQKSKYLCSLFFISTLILLSACQKILYADKTQKVTLIKIFKVDFQTETIIGIDCDQFIKQFGLYMDTITIDDKRVQKKILKYVQSARSENWEGSIDARAKMFISYDKGTSDTLCFAYDFAFILNNNRMLLPNLDLIKMLDKLKNN